MKKDIKELHQRVDLLIISLIIFFFIFMAFFYSTDNTHTSKYCVQWTGGITRENIEFNCRNGSKLFCDKIITEDQTLVLTINDSKHSFPCLYYAKVYESDSGIIKGERRG